MQLHAINDRCAKCTQNNNRACLRAYIHTYIYLHCAHMNTYTGKIQRTQLKQQLNQFKQLYQDVINKQSSSSSSSSPSLSQQQPSPNKLALVDGGTYIQHTHKTKQKQLQASITLRSSL